MEIKSEAGGNGVTECLRSVDDEKTEVSTGDLTDCLRSVHDDKSTSGMFAFQMLRCPQTSVCTCQLILFILFTLVIHYSLTLSLHVEILPRQQILPIMHCLTVFTYFLSIQDLS